MPKKEDINDVIDSDSSYKAQGEAFAKVLNGWKEDVEPKMMAINQGVHPKELIADWSESLLAKTMEHSGLVDAYDTYDVLLNYWADTMQDDCYMISNDGWTYPEVKAIKVKEVKEKKNKKDNGSDTESNKSKTKEVSEYESEVNGNLAEMGFTL